MNNACLAEPGGRAGVASPQPDGSPGRNAMAGACHCHDADPLPPPLTRSQPNEARLAILQPLARVDRSSWPMASSTMARIGKAVSDRSAARFALGVLRTVVHCFGARADTAWHA